MVIKTLALAKLNHLIISLPNPSANIVKTIQNLFYKYLWSSGPDKIKRNIITQKYEKGGLRFINLENFMNAIKLTWLRRESKMNTKYFEFVKGTCPLFTNYNKFGSMYTSQQVRLVENEFWNQVFQAYSLLSNKIKPNNWFEFLQIPVWHNSNIKIGGKPIFDNRFVNKGILFINDFMNVSGRFLSFEEFTNLYGETTNFLQYNNIIFSLRGYLDKIRIAHKAINSVFPQQPLTTKLINACDKGCRLIYDCLNSNDSVSNANHKWQLDLPTINLDWQKIYKLPFFCTIDSKLQWFQFRINHRILGTNNLLFKMGIRNDNLCSFCGIEPETLCHLFWDCQISNRFWANLKAMITVKCPNINIEWSKPDIMLGKRELQIALNTIILLGKYHIYQNKMKHTLPHMPSFRNQLTLLIKAEKFNAKQTFKLDNYEKIWGPFSALCTDNQ